MFDQAKNFVIRTAKGAEDAKQQAEICSVSLPCKIICSYEMCSSLEIASNFQPDFRTARLIPSNLHPIYHKPLPIWDISIECGT